MSITLKLSSLVIRTLSKPIANQIKAQAREHERFRRVCISFAQSLHRVDMRLRLGLLQNSAAIEKQAAREAAEAQAKKHKQHVTTVKTEAQTKLEETIAAKQKERTQEPPKPPPLRIRPLSEAKAIDSGATFISETFLFIVAGGLIVFEAWRSRRKETNRREDVADRLTDLEESEREARLGITALEKEVAELKALLEKQSLANKRNHGVEEPSWIARIIGISRKPKQQSSGDIPLIGATNSPDSTKSPPGSKPPSDLVVPSAAS
ncbi:hypothetical protein FQN50_003985 [Emmonsiellopsis sp. PD_5]|nr:hypothetical protein FQN50_003985 [Emmonsiellopsis sp. PD_5]